MLSVCENITNVNTLDCNANNKNEVNHSSDNSSFKEPVKNQSNETTNIFSNTSTNFSLGNNYESINISKPSVISENQLKPSKTELNREYIDLLKRNLMDNLQTVSSHSKNKSSVDSFNLVNIAQSRISILKAKYKNQPCSTFKPNEEHLRLLKNKFLNSKSCSLTNNSMTKKSSDEAVSLLNAKRKDLFALKEHYKLLISQDKDIGKNADNNTQKNYIVPLKSVYSDFDIISKESSVDEKDLSKTTLTSNVSMIQLKNSNEAKMKELAVKKESFESEMAARNKGNSTQAMFDKSGGGAKAGYSPQFLDNLKAQRKQEIYRAWISKLQTNKIKQSINKPRVHNVRDAKHYNKKMDAIKALVDKFKHSQVKRNPITKAKSQILNDRSLILRKMYSTFLASRRICASNSKLTLSKQCAEKDPALESSSEQPPEVSVDKADSSLKTCQTSTSTGMGRYFHYTLSETGIPRPFNENNAATSAKMNTNLNCKLTETSVTRSTHENNFVDPNSQPKWHPSRNFLSKRDTTNFPFNKEPEICKQKPDKLISVIKKKKSIQLIRIEEPNSNAQPIKKDFKKLPPISLYTPDPLFPKIKPIKECYLEHTNGSKQKPISSIDNLSENSDCQFICKLEISEDSKPENSLIDSFPLVSPEMSPKSNLDKDKCSNFIYSSVSLPSKQSPTNLPLETIMSIKVVNSPADAFIGSLEASLNPTETVNSELLGIEHENAKNSLEISNFNCSSVSLSSKQSPTKLPLQNNKSVNVVNSQANAFIVPQEASLNLTETVNNELLFNEHENAKNSLSEAKLNPNLNSSSLTNENFLNIVLDSKSLPNENSQSQTKLKRALELWKNALRIEKSSETEQNSDLNSNSILTENSSHSLAELNVSLNCDTLTNTNYSNKINLNSDLSSNSSEIKSNSKFNSDDFKTKMSPDIELSYESNSNAAKCSHSDNSELSSRDIKIKKSSKIKLNDDNGLTENSSEIDRNSKLLKRESSEIILKSGLDFNCQNTEKSSAIELNNDPNYNGLAIENSSEIEPDSHVTEKTFRSEIKLNFKVDSKTDERSKILRSCELDSYSKASKTKVSSELHAKAELSSEIEINSGSNFRSSTTDNSSHSKIKLGVNFEHMNISSANVISYHPRNEGYDENSSFIPKTDTDTLSVFVAQHKSMKNKAIVSNKEDQDTEMSKQSYNSNSTSINKNLPGQSFVEECSNQNSKNDSNNQHLCSKRDMSLEVSKLINKGVIKNKDKNLVKNARNITQINVLPKGKETEYEDNRSLTFKQTDSTLSNDDRNTSNPFWTVKNAEELPKMKRLILKLQRLPPHFLNFVPSDQNDKPSSQDFHNLNGKKECMEDTYKRKGKNHKFSNKPESMQYIETTNKGHSIDGFSAHFSPFSTENGSEVSVHEHCNAKFTSKSKENPSPTLEDSNQALSFNPNCFVSDSNPFAERENVNLKRKCHETNKIARKKTCQNTIKNLERFVDNYTNSSPILTEAIFSTKCKKKKSKKSKKKRKLLETNRMVDETTRRNFWEENCRGRFVDSGIVSSPVLPDEAYSSTEGTSKINSEIFEAQTGRGLENSRKKFVNGVAYQFPVLTDLKCCQETGKISKSKSSLPKTTEIVVGKKTQSYVENNSNRILDSGVEGNSILPSSSVERSSKDQNFSTYKEVSTAVFQECNKNVSYHGKFDDLSSKKMHHRNNSFESVENAIHKKSIAMPHKELRVKLFKLPYLPRKVKIPLTRLPNIIYEKHEKGKPIMLSSVVPLLQSDTNINSPEIIRRTSNILRITETFQSEEQRMQPKKLRVDLIKLPNYIYNNHIKGKPIMLSNILPTITRVESVSMFNTFIKTEDY